MTVPFRLTGPTRAVLSVLLESRQPLWGLGVCAETGLVHGTVFPILKRLHEHGWTATSEEQGPHPGRPPRIYHQLTGLGRAHAEAVFGAGAVPARSVLRAAEGTHVVRVIVSGPGSGRRACEVAEQVLAVCGRSTGLRVTVDGTAWEPAR